MALRTDKYNLRKGLSKAWFYTYNFVRYMIPNIVFRTAYHLSLPLSKSARLEVERRVNYYLRLPDNCRPDTSQWTAIADFKYPFGKKKKFSGYFFDLYETLRCFSPKARFQYLFGDINYHAAEPAFVKSRPISAGPTCSVLMKLNKTRHFVFLHDRIPFEKKLDMLVMRNFVLDQPQRTLLIEKFFNHPLCDVGQINPHQHPEYQKPYLSISQMLRYKFVMCIEGNDVATALKWVMSSNSLAVMPRPTMETWFMEGTLQAGVHYIEVAPDYSDLEEKIRYYIAHPNEAKAIIKNAHRYVKQFYHPLCKHLPHPLEGIIQREVAKRYIAATNHL